MRCIVCNTTLKSFGKRKDFTILKCPKCGLGQTENLSAQNSDYHRDETYIEEEKLFQNIFEKRVDKITKFVKSGKVLEVGCSTGLMLYLLKEKGYEVKGIEISKTAGDIAKKRDIEVLTQKFEKINFTEKFDLIIFNHTLEHLEDPKAIIKKARTMLKPKGFLYIDLPNFGGFSAGLSKTRWPMLLPSEHLWHFTLKAMTKLLQDQEFKVIFSERASGVWDYKHPIRGILFSLTHFKKRFFKELFTMIPTFILSKMGQGSDLMVIARKK